MGPSFGRAQLQATALGHANWDGAPGASWVEVGVLLLNTLPP